jgi:alpha-beta hydrolase superfamily lysophospholipase
VGKQLSDANAEVYAFDRRGFGNSVELGLSRGDTSDFNRHLTDLKEVAATVRAGYPGKRLFLFAHSIGCAYALWYAARYPESVDGLILAAPPVVPGFKVPTREAFELPFQSVFEPHHMFDLLDHWPQAFKESEEYRLITQDELCTEKFGVSWLVNVQTKLANKMLNNASIIDKPTLVLHGETDIIALPEGAKKLIEHLKTQDKTLQTFGGADHWFFQALIPTASSKYSDEARQTVSKVVKDWLAR